MSNLYEVHNQEIEKPRTVKTHPSCNESWPIKKTSENAKIENPKLRKHVHSARKNNVANSQRPRSYTNPQSTILRTQEFLEHRELELAFDKTTAICVKHAGQHI